MMDRTEKFRVCEALNHTTLHEHKTTKTFVALVYALVHRLKGGTGLCPGTSVKGRDWLETSPLNNSELFVARKRYRDGSILYNRKSFKSWKETSLQSSV